jgi:hypothetical protein
VQGHRAFEEGSAPDRPVPCGISDAGHLNQILRDVLAVCGAQQAKREHHFPGVSRLPVAKPVGPA